jgi:hypothetical protein
MVSPTAVYVDVPPTTVPEMSYSMLPGLHAPCPGEEVARLAIVVSPLDFQVKILVRAADEARRFAADLGVHCEMVIVPVDVPFSLAHWTLGAQAPPHPVDVVYVNRSAALVALLPPAVTTVTWTVSASSTAGVTAVIDESSFTVNPAGVPPKSTAVASVKFAPVIVTVVPPSTVPLSGLMPDTVGAAMNVNWSLELEELVPPAVVTVTSTVPALAAGDTAVIDVSPFTVKLAASVEPKVTAVAPVNPVPVIVTLVPPAAGPAVTDTLVTLGGATKSDARVR